MEPEFIVETTSGSLYHLTYHKGFFEHGGRFSCKQLVGRTVDFGRDYLPVLNFVEHNERMITAREKLDLKHLRLGVRIFFGVAIGGTSPIVRIFQRTA